MSHAIKDFPLLDAACRRHGYGLSRVPQAQKNSLEHLTPPATEETLRLRVSVSVKADGEDIGGFQRYIAETEFLAHMEAFANSIYLALMYFKVHLELEVVPFSGGRPYRCSITCDGRDASESLKSIAQELWGRYVYAFEPRRARLES